MSISTPKAHEAEIVFREAYDKKCVRSEMYIYWIKAKHELEDWKGVLQIAEIAPQELLKGDIALIQLTAIVQLAEEAGKRSDLPNQERMLLDAVQFASSIIHGQNATGYKEEVSAIQSDAALRYLRAIYERVRDDSRSYLELFIASMDVFDCYVTRKDLIYAGCKALEQWWEAVESKSNYDSAAVAILGKALSRLQKLSKVLNPQYAGRYNAHEIVLHTIELLGKRKVEYENRKN